jgi:hypothetical protein
LVHTCLMVRGGSLLRFVGQRSRSQLLKIEQKFDTFFVSAYLKNEMLDGWTIHVYPDSFRSDISFLRYCVETKKVSTFCSIFRSCDLDLCPAETKKVSNFCSIFKSCDLDLKNEMLNLNESWYTHA